MTKRSFAVPAAIGVALGGVLWVLDSEFRSFVYPSGTFLEELLHPAPDVLTIRILAFILAVMTSLTAGVILQLVRHHDHTLALRRRLSALYRHTPDPILGLDRSLRILFANEAAGSMVNRAPEELEGRACHSAIKGRSTPCDGCRAAEVFESAEVASREAFECLSPGRERWIDQSWRPFIDDDGTVEIVIEVVRDITRLKLYESEVAERERAEANLLAERDRTQRYLDATTSLMVAVSADGTVSMVNRRFCEVVERPCIDVLGRPWSEVMQHAPGCVFSTDGIDEVTELVLAGDGRYEETLTTASGGKRRIAWGVSPMYDEDRVLTAVLCSGVDVTEQRAAEAELEFKSFLLDNAADQIVVHDPDGRLVYANEAFCTLRGVTSAQAFSATPFGWIPEEARARGAAFAREIGESGSSVYEGVMRSRDGHLIPLEIHACRAVVDGRHLVVSSARDISERKEAEETIARMAFYDELTGLANRALFLDRLRIALANSIRSEHPVAVIFLDLDYFKHINDTLGHTVGDQLLQAVATRLAVNVREGDTLARLGGDEFTLVIPECAGEMGAEFVARKILSALEEPFELADGRCLSVSASIGLTVGTGDRLDVEEALSRADAAMYHAKEHGRNRYRVYRDHMGEATSERFSLREQLTVAVSRDEFDLHFQPQIDVLTGRMVAAEALLRWNHPDRGLLRPTSFLHIAEEAGLMPKIGASTLERAVDVLVEWQRKGLTDLRMSVNLSPRELLDPLTVPLIERLLAEKDVDPSRFEIELTETTALTDPNETRATLERIRTLGVAVAIDDFGTGFSSLDHLRRLPIDEVKIDRSFVQEIGVVPGTDAIARSVIDLARSLGLRVIAEGVETPLQRDFLREHGCYIMQGFLFSEAVPAEAILNLADRDLVRSTA